MPEAALALACALEPLTRSRQEAIANAAAAITSLVVPDLLGESQVRSAQGWFLGMWQ